jgi:hypothetical protein
MTLKKKISDNLNIPIPFSIKTVNISESDLNF